MNDSEYKNIFKHESTHFFYRTTHELIIKLVRKLGASRKSLLLDVGCGTGLLVKKLATFTNAQGVDSHPNAHKFAKLRKINIRKGSISNLPYQANTFDVIVCIDVLCHRSIKSDHRALLELKRILKPEGSLIIRVPAHQFLYSNHDSYVYTKKRYEYKHFRNALLKAGLSVPYYSYMNLFLFIPSYLKSLLESKSTTEVKSSVSRTSPFLNVILYKLLSLESFFMTRRLPLPFGIELLAICNKKPSR